MKNALQQLVKRQRQIGLMLLLCLFTSPAWAVDGNHLMSSLQQGTIIVQDIAILMGLAFLVGGLFKMKRYGEARTFMSQQVTLAKPLASLIVGTALLCVPVATNTILAAFWGSANPLPFPQLVGPGDMMAKSIIMLVRFIGLLGLIRGIVLFSRVGGEQSQPGTAGKALLHIFGGILCLHVLNTYYLLKYIISG